MIVMVSSSLAPKSRSLALAQSLLSELQGHAKTSLLIDLATETLPCCDGNQCYQDPRVRELTQQIKDADGIIICSPVYNYDLNAAAKNFVELTGNGWENKVVGFACTAGGKTSFMAPLSFANSLMLDFRCLIVPRFVYATNEDYDSDRQPDENLRARLAKLADEVSTLAYRNAT
jgi:NAD(P)H-dependent FMN reductase